MAYRQYTHCVNPADYVYPLPPTDNVFGVIAALLDAALGGWLPDAILGCDYLLGGKLVCLGGDECAIGHITHFELPSEKSFPQNLDNDFALNILLAPPGARRLRRGGQPQGLPQGRGCPAGRLAQAATQHADPPRGRGRRL